MRILIVNKHAHPMTFNFCLTSPWMKQHAFVSYALTVVNRSTDGKNYQFSDASFLVVNNRRNEQLNHFRRKQSFRVCQPNNRSSWGDFSFPCIPYPLSVHILIFNLCKPQRLSLTWFVETTQFCALIFQIAIKKMDHINTIWIIGSICMYKYVEKFVSE